MVPGVEAEPLAPGEEVPVLAGTPPVPVFFLAEGETGPVPEGTGGPAEVPTIPPEWDGPLKVSERDFLRGKEATFFFFGCGALEVEGEVAAAVDDDEDDDDTYLFFVSFLRTTVRSSIQDGSGAAAEATGPGCTCPEGPGMGATTPQAGTTTAGTGTGAVITGTEGWAGTSSILCIGGRSKGELLGHRKSGAGARAAKPGAGVTTILLTSGVACTAAVGVTITTCCVNARSGGAT
ncbi:uncharacterized protein LOC135200656 [Macrobrachium nipponense]|uniref:uncharacterized protein LOC135200656 n=1 Tax=Macrobrachium nipponense TaxID=159736 RepID=UPI0030C89073